MTTSSPPARAIRCASSCSLPSRTSASTGRTTCASTRRSSAALRSCTIWSETRRMHANGSAARPKRGLQSSYNCSSTRIAPACRRRHPRREADDYRELLGYARGLGVPLFAAVFDFESADLLAELDVPAFKFASGDLRNTPLQRYVAGFGKPMFLSTGGGTMEDIDRAVDTILPINDQLCVLQCTAAYPADVEDLNLNVITTLRERFPELVIGLSDHQNGIAMAVVAYMLGARVVEKHFTLNHAAKGTDHAFSLMPEGMRKLVRDLQRVPDALGDGIKRPLAIEEAPIRKMGKKLVAGRELEVGHILAAEDVAIKSPADGGLPPYELDRIVGLRLRRRLAP